MKAIICTKYGPPDVLKLAVYLIAKGFKSSAIASESAKTETNELIAAQLKEVSPFLTLREMVAFLRPLVYTGLEP
jgi:hypothetical protein